MAGLEVRAKYLRIAPRKVRLVADLIRGKTVSEARDILQFTVKRGAPILGKLLASAVANAESLAAERRERIDTDEMIIGQILVDGGPTRRKFQPAPRGRATRIRKRSSHVMLALVSQEQEEEKE